MGISAESATAIVYLRIKNFVEDEILTLGRQEMFATQHELMKIN